MLRSVEIGLAGRLAGFPVAVAEGEGVAAETTSGELDMGLRHRRQMGPLLASYSMVIDSEPPA
jgi:hypothetical protein